MRCRHIVVTVTHGGRHRPALGHVPSPRRVTCLLRSCRGYCDSLDMRQSGVGTSEARTQPSDSYMACEDPGSGGRRSIALRSLRSGGPRGAPYPLRLRGPPSVLAKTYRGPALPIVGTAVISAVGEEVFFRGALYTAIAGRHPVGWTTLAYGLVTIATGNLALVAAALGLGIVTGVQRRSTGGWWLLSSPIPSVTILALPR